ncbi:hypothetical protein OS493_025952 [Desmophyllum pertusum]|uniref:Uncharacterized protein n=1 Tax=Desmophyllum pertusum TaxID=174260 RepID=A0A9W9YL33_9CNID|nr:hypothetical protein OS493_025952 [Desmophyllum pertusum]
MGGSAVFTDLRIILGVAFGGTITSDPQGIRRQNLCLQFVPFLMETVRILPMIAFPILYFLNGDEKWVTIGVFSYLVSFCCSL